VDLLGLAAGTFVVAQRPAFWLEFGSRLGKALLPLAWRYVSRRMPPEEEAAWLQSERRGEGEEWLRPGRERRAINEIFGSSQPTCWNEKRSNADNHTVRDNWVRDRR
jgi:hypothetical protein